MNLAGLRTQTQNAAFFELKGPELGNENSARSFTDRSFLKPAWGHGRPRLRVMDFRTKMLVFFQDFEGLTEAFAPGRPPGYPRGRPQSIRPRNLLFGLLFRS